MKVNNRKFLQLVLSLVVILGVSSCSKKSSSSGKGASRATGWNVNNRKGGFKQPDEQQAGPGLVFIEGGTFTMGKVQDDVMHDWNNTPNQ